MNKRLNSAILSEGPRIGLGLILALPLVSSLAATMWPASRAANIRPAIALRAAD